MNGSSHSEQQNCGHCKPCARLKVIPLGLAIGALAAISTILFGWLSVHTHWGVPMLQAMSSLYLGFKPTLMGSLHAAGWSFLDGFISGVLLALFYNLFCCLCCCVKRKGCHQDKNLKNKA